MKNNKIDNVGNMIEAAIHESKNLKEGILKAEWGKIVGRLVEKSQPEYLKDKVLTITVEGPIFIHHFNGNKQEYIGKINEYFKTDLVEDIEIKSGKLNEQRYEYLDLEEKKDQPKEQEKVKPEVVEKIIEEDEVEFDQEEYKEDEFDLQFEDEQKELEEIQKKEVIKKKKEKPRRAAKETFAYDTTGKGIIKKIQQLEKLAREREEYLLSNGYIKCKGCGVVFEATEDEEFCRVCLSVKKNRRKQD